VPNEATRKQYLNTLRSEADRLSHLVENVLSYARLERGRDGGRRENVAFAELLGRVEPRLRQRAEAAGMDLRCEACGAASGPVRVDPLAVEQILFNLVDNACKYARGAADRRIVLSAETQRRCLAVRVRDFGPGLAPAGLRTVFQRFRKSAAAAAESAPGVGLGLALSRRFARRMGGDLALAPPHSGEPGACFVLTLPRTKR
jgi:signal transduction histidine kinase